MVNVGLVVEGPHDLIMLQPLIEREFSIKHGEGVSFIPIQPIRDATGSYSHGGWSQVMAWCLANAGAKLESLFEPLFVGDPKLDVIVIHLDGDALDLVRPHVPLQLPASPLPVPDRMSALQTVISSWLSPNAQEESRLVLAFPTMQTECWILAAENHPDTNEGTDAKSIFRANHRKGRAVGPLYRKRVHDAEPGFSGIAALCQSYVHFEGEVASVTW